MDARWLRLDLRLLASSKRGAGGGPSQTLFPIIERGRRDRVERSRFCDGLYATRPGIVGLAL